MITDAKNSSLVNSFITAFIAILPDPVWSYAEKVLSVLVLAVVAELGRRLVGLFWKKEK